MPVGSHVSASALQCPSANAASKFDFAASPKYEPTPTPTTPTAIAKLPPIFCALGPSDVAAASRGEDDVVVATASASSGGTSTLTVFAFAIVIFVSHVL